MLQFISGVFKGWKHETFGQCFLDYAWLIQEELPQSEIGGGGPDQSDTAPRHSDEDVFDEPYQAYVKQVNEQRAEEWRKSLEPEHVAKGREKDYDSLVGQVAPERIDEEAAEKAAFVIQEAQKGAELARKSLGELTKASKEAIAARHDEEAALAAFAFLMLED